MARTAKSTIATKEMSDRLYEAILTLKTKEECYNFFQDLCTISELRSMEQRYEVAVLLDSGMIYDSSMLHDNIPDPAASMEDVCLRAVNAYISYLYFNTDFMWAEHESREELSASDISIINDTLK